MYSVKDENKKLNLVTEGDLFITELTIEIKNILVILSRRSKGQKC